MTSLANRARPTTFFGVVGQDMTTAALQGMVNKQQVPQSLLFSGPSGTGKTSCARILADALSAEVTEVDAATHGSVAELRTLLDNLRYGGHPRVVILDEVHSISKEGFDALLKTLEEPPANVTFVLVTTAPSQIPPTARSRMIEFEFRRLSLDAMMDMLVGAVTHAPQAGLSYTQERMPEDRMLMDIAERANGSARRAFTMLEQADLADITTSAEFRDLQGEYDYAPNLIAAMVSGDPAETERTLSGMLRRASTPQSIVSSLISTFRDLQVLRAGGTLDAEGPALDKRRALSSVIAPEAALNALSALWVYKQMLASSEDPATDLRLACAIIENQIARK